MISENTRVVKAAGVVGAATTLSRLLGFVRDVAIAWYFGAGFSTDAFIAAFRIPNLLRRLFAEGSLSAAFVPVFTDYTVNRGRTEAFALARSAFRVLALLLALITLCGIMLAPWIVRAIAPGFDADKLMLTVTLTRLMFPYVFFIGMVALCMGILNVLGHFAVPALAPVLLNIAIIGAVLLVCPYMSRPVIGLAGGVLVGGILQLSLQLPVLVRLGFRFWQRGRFLHPGLKKIGILLPPVILGGAVYQISIVVGTLLASLLPEGSISYLYFADRLVQFPLGIFAIATATAVLPSFSRQAAAGDFKALQDTFAHTMQLVLFISIPAMVGLIVLREPIVQLLFQRGQFDARATQLTAEALLYYAIGLWAFSAVRIVAAIFFALQDTRTPVLMAVFSIAVNIILGVVLMDPLGHGGLALATSLASMLNLGLLLYALQRRLKTLEYSSILRSMIRTATGSAVMGLGVWAVARLLVPTANESMGALMGGVAACVAAGLVIYGGFSYAVRTPELLSAMAELRKGIGRK